MKLWQWILRFFGFKRKPVYLVSPAEQKSMKQIMEEKRERFVAKFRPKGYREPRSMTEQEKELYKIKPNLQYWVDKGML